MVNYLVGEGVGDLQCDDLLWKWRICQDWLPCRQRLDGGRLATPKKCHTCYKYCNSSTWRPC
jgi:hypothetical protein